MICNHLFLSTPLLPLFSCKHCIACTLIGHSLCACATQLNHCRNKFINFDWIASIYSFEWYILLLVRCAYWFRTLSRMDSHRIRIVEKIFFLYRTSQTHLHFENRQHRNVIYVPRTAAHPQPSLLHFVAEQNHGVNQIRSRIPLLPQIGIREIGDGLVDCRCALIKPHASDNAR